MNKTDKYKERILEQSINYSLYLNKKFKQDRVDNKSVLFIDVLNEVLMISKSSIHKYNKTIKRRGPLTVYISKMIIEDAYKIKVNYEKTLSGLSIPVEILKTFFEYFTCLISDNQDIFDEFMKLEKNLLYPYVRVVYEAYAKYKIDFHQDYYRFNLNHIDQCLFSMNPQFEDPFKN